MTQATAARKPPLGRIVALASGYEMHYTEHGQGPPVVFVHGSGPGANAWSNFSVNVGPLTAAGFRCVLPDMIGFGYSSKPSGIDYTLALFAPTLLEFLDRVEIRRCVLVGNSLGGAIAMRLAIDHPDRVEKLVMTGPGGIETREVYFKMPGIQKMVSGFVGAGFDRAGLRRMLELLSYDPKHVTDDLLEERWNVLQTQPKDVLARMSITDLTPELDRIRCPLLGFWGVEDQFCPSTGYEKILRAVPDSRFIIYARTGHWAMIEQAHDFNKNVSEFLQR
jgi:4,5:9,10-diseco-3-hydroxy-5,9,17-trioxoandrosta-1(10),2-diene-4-oate hydrolase